MIEHITHRFIKISHQFNTMLYQKLWAHLEDIPEKNSMTSQTLNLFKKEVGIRNFCCLFKITKNQSLSYLSQLVPHQTTGILDKTQKILPNFAKNATFLKDSFPSQLKRGRTIWTCKSENLKGLVFSKSNILKFTRPKPNSIFYCHNLKRIRLVTRLGFGLCYFCKHKFKHRFLGCLILDCFCCNDLNIFHYLFHCPTYTNEMKGGILELSDAVMKKIIRF